MRIDPTPNAKDKQAYRPWKSSIEPGAPILGPPIFEVPGTVAGEREIAPNVEQQRREHAEHRDAPARHGFLRRAHEARTVAHRWLEENCHSGARRARCPSV